MWTGGSTTSIIHIYTTKTNTHTHIYIYICQKTYIKHFSFRKLQTCLSPSIHCQNTRTSCLGHWCLHIEQPQAQHPPTSTHYYESTSPPEAPPTSTHYYESTSPPEAPPTSTHYYESTSPPEAPPTSTHYYESTSPPEVWDLLVSDASWYHHRETQNHSPEHSLSPFLAGGMIFPPPSGMLDPCQISSNNWKLISFNSTWLLKKKKKMYFTFFKIFIFLFIFLSFPS